MQDSEGTGATTHYLNIPIDTSSVTRVQPRASKGMTDLLLHPVSDDCKDVVNPSKKICQLRGASAPRITGLYVHDT